MHFRHIMIAGLMAGAAMLLPGHSLAAKNEQSHMPPAVHAAAQADSAVKAELPAPAQAAEKAKTATVKSVGKPPASQNSESHSNMVKPKQNQGNAQKAAANPKSAANQKAVEKRKQLPEQAKAKGQSAVQKAAKAANAAGSKNPAALKKQEKAISSPAKFLEEKQPDVQKEGKAPVVQTLHQKEVKVERKSPAAEKTTKPDKKRSQAKRPVVIKPLFPNPLNQGSTPTEKDKVPRADQVLNPTQRSSNSGGSSNDRGTSGLGTMGTVDKWFEWNPYFEIQPVQHYLSRMEWLTNQWVNAPPSPPPQNAPIFKHVSHS